MQESCPYIDTHIHLNLDVFENDLDTVIKRARGAGVDRMITIGTDLQSSRASVLIAERYPEVWAAVGIHPHESACADQNDPDEIALLTRHPRVVAIGEIGLDYYYDHSPRDIQQSLFQVQMKMARQLHMPVIIHAREAMDDAIEAIDASGPSPWKGVFHCFSGTLEDVSKVLKRGFHLSFTGVVTFKNFKQADTVKAVPIRRLLLETDAPFMTPVPHRGKRNEPVYLPYTAQWIADTYEIPLETLVNTCTQNALSLFRWE